MLEGQTANANLTVGVGREAGLRDWVTGHNLSVRRAQQQHGAEKE
jgi:hypothetical protein